MYLLKSMLPYDASTEYTPMPSDAGQHRNQQQFWLSKAQAKDLYFYLLSSPMARHPHDKQIGIAVGCTSQIFSLGSPTIGERSGARRSMELGSKLRSHARAETRSFLATMTTDAGGHPERRPPQWQKNGLPAPPRSFGRR